ncbi:helix-turn-helix domain-containing protein [Ferroacidibacillus organovorans]|uniref:HTH cro/C1-type domain-containing protein n=1 Tax=Ferroacidibacillus organovorans TaxID=1765683 RepID=A0A1V4EUS3_9BACL|nr:helix-turn-helix transcriptional regulator [Ferroacidibacillus organovorans]OPG16685.1 hypothetical protein B2M26_05355 [Ferroacidibacillus organovorans]
MFFVFYHSMTHTKCYAYSPIRYRHFERELYNDPEVIDMNSLGEKIKYRKLLKSLSVADVARESGESISYIYAIEAGQKGSNLQNLAKIARVLGLLTEELWPEG